MKKVICTALAAVCCLSFGGCATSGVGLGFTIVLAIVGILLLGVAALRTVQYLGYRKRRMAAGKRVRPIDLLTVLCYVLAVLALVGILLIPGGEKTPEVPDAPDTSTADTAAVPETTDPPIVYAPHKTASTDPANWGISWEIFRDGQKVDSYERSEPIFFGSETEYFAGKGVATFRGNNYRTCTGYGTADAIVNKTYSTAWTATTGTLEGGVWSGSGWTGQPLMARWDEQTKKLMNLYPEKQAKADLVEVIYATLDGHIYFLDLDDGSATRDPINIGMCFKGAGALDPRGYPIMYVGSGDVNYYGERPRAYIISLIDGSVLYEFGADDPLALRQDNSRWTAFDSSPLVDAETDTLIWPGENGILYTMKLNTSFDKAAGTLSIAPSEQVVARYSAQRSSADKYWLGFEASASVCENYLYISENGGLFFCIDLNTMELIWAQDTRDDSNGSPVFVRTAEDAGVIYTAPSLHWTQDENAQGQISIYKLDAITGQILWQTPYNVHTVSGVSGGVQSTVLLNHTDGLVYCTVARTPDVYSGLLVALDMDTGAEVWRMSMTNYAWSSPVLLADNAGSQYVAVADSMGYLFLLDAASGEQLYVHELGGLVEATPAVYLDKLVVGTRAEKIVCIEIS